MDRGEQCVYIADNNTAAEILKAMRKEGIDVETVTKSGALTVAGKRDAYLRGGRFDPDSMIDFLNESTDSAKAAGFSALRVTGEMTWALGSEPGVERLMEYEAKLNTFLPDHDVLAICQYNKNRFPDDLILNVVRTHPMIIFGEIISDNPNYITPEEFFDPKPELELKRTLQNVVDRDESRRNSRLIHVLSERVKELNCLYGITKMVAVEDVSLAEITKRTTELIPPSWQYSDITCARIRLNGHDYKTMNFKETIWKQSAEITVSGQKSGEVEVYYLEEKPELYEGPFLKEERELIEGISVLLAKTAERQKAEQFVREQQQMIRELSTPVMPVSDRLLVLPIIGTIDSRRARQLTMELLRSIREHRAKVAVLDITGVATVDSAVANHIIQTVQAARLLGAIVIVTGLSPQNSQTLAGLGLDLSRVKTAGDLRSGIEEANRLLGYTIVKTDAEAA